MELIVGGFSFAKPGETLYLKLQPRNFNLQIVGLEALPGKPQYLNPNLETLNNKPQYTNLLNQYLYKCLFSTKPTVNGVLVAQWRVSRPSPLTSNLF